MCGSLGTTPVATEQEDGGFQIRDEYDELSEPRSIQANMGVSRMEEEKRA